MYEKDGKEYFRLYDVDVPQELQIPVPTEEPASPESAVGVAG